MRDSRRGSVWCNEFEFPTWLRWFTEAYSGLLTRSVRSQVHVGQVVEGMVSYHGVRLLHRRLVLAFRLAGGSNRVGA